MMPIVAFGGPSQSGKTTVARRLADLFQCKFASFGDYVRNEAWKRGNADPTRRQLQDIGEELARDMLSFCRNVLGSVNYVIGEKIVVDGIRHPEAVKVLSDLSNGKPVKLIYLWAPTSVRGQRMKDGFNNLDIRVLDAHPVESQTPSDVRALADLVVETSGDFEDVFANVATWVRKEVFASEMRSTGM